MNSILTQVVERNRVRRSLSAKRHALQSWRSVVETILTACPADLITTDQRQLIIRDLLLDLHDKVRETVYGCVCVQLEWLASLCTLRESSDVLKMKRTQIFRVVDKLSLLSYKKDY